MNTELIEFEGVAYLYLANFNSDTLKRCTINESDSIKFMDAQSILDIL